MTAGKDEKQVLSTQAREQEEAATGTDGLPPLAGCYADGDCVDALFGSADRKQELNEQEGGRGMGQVVVARMTHGRYKFCVYLVDFWCLGVKNAFGPRTCNRDEFNRNLDLIYREFSTGYREISLQQAQAIVFGAERYAEGLGFKPHRDFRQARPFLGEWDGEPELEFGRNGQPFFMNGPYDDVDKILTTLRRSVGEDNFKYLIEMPTGFI